MIQTKFQDSEQKPILQSQLLQGEAGIEHYCSMRGFENAGDGVWMPRQVHGIEIAIVNEQTPYDPNIELQPIEADAVITQLKDQWIGVRTADCVPILLYDPKTCTVAAVHAGWRGTVKHIVKKVVEKLQTEFSVSPEDIRAMIGPSISPEAFEVGEEVAALFEEENRGDCVIRKSFAPHGGYMHYKKPHIDLWQSNAMDLMEAGVLLEHIDCTPLCTVQNEDVLFSARKQGIETGRIVTAIKLVSKS